MYIRIIKNLIIDYKSRYSRFILIEINIRLVLWYQIKNLEYGYIRNRKTEI